MPKKPKKLNKTQEKSSATTHQHKKTAPRSGAEKKPKQYKSKQDKIADGEELPVIVRFEI